jgi:hypothetical protein
MPEATFGIFNTMANLVTVAAILGYLNHRFIGLPHTISLTIMDALSSVNSTHPPRHSPNFV